MEQYIELRNSIDGEVEKLSGEHQAQMACKKGCDKCCLNFDVFPIEFDAIKQQVEKEYPEVLEQKKNEKAGDQCLFLIDHACSIYNARPIICRTHGFPLLNMNEAGDQWELSFCELNFTQVDDEYFHEDNCYVQDTVNSQLFMMNKDYIQTVEEHKGKSEFDLVPLRELVSER